MKAVLTSSILATIFLSLASMAFAGTLIVGPSGCEPNFPHFATIQAAVNAAPAAGAMVWVCPGTYPEQVQIIGKKVTLKGVSYQGSDAAIIAPPAGGLVPNATSTFDGSEIEAMVLVQNSAAAVIEDLTVDATNNGTQCGQDPIGIFYQNASGSITHNNVLHVQVPDGAGCQGGLGIYVESGATTIPPNPSNAANSTVSITYNNVHDYAKNGITANGTLTGTTSNVGVTIKNNTVIGAGATDQVAQNGIQLAGANGTIISNLIDGDWYTGSGGYAATGILIIQSTSPFVQSNNISNTNAGIYIQSVDPDDTDNATITKNTITATHLYDGIILCANTSKATSNTINVADESGINVAACGDAAPVDTITSNTINGACAGVLIAPPASATPSGTYFNVGSQTLTTSSDTCATPLVKRQSGRRPNRPTASPARKKISP